MSVKLSLTASMLENLADSRSHGSLEVFDMTLKSRRNGMRHSKIYQNPKEWMRMMRKKTENLQKRS